jgi:hypothetical protein
MINILIRRDKTYTTLLFYNLYFIKSSVKKKLLPPVSVYPGSRRPPAILSGRRNAPSFDRDVAPQGRLNGTTGLPVGLH